MLWPYLYTAAAATALLSTASAFKLIIDSNTMTIADLTNASKGALRSDGSYSIFVNTVPQASDKLWKAYIDGVSPTDASAALEFTEENPGTYDSCKMYQRIQGKPPTASMGYHETGLIAGGTLISDSEIDKQAKECNSPVNVLTRSFCKTEPNKFRRGTDDSWIVNTTRALANPKVYAVQMEFTPSWPLDGMQGCGVIDLMHLAISMNKTMMMLLPVYVNNKEKEAWQNIQDLVEGLYAHGAPMHSDSVVLALARYDTRPPRGPVPWWGKQGNTVQHAFNWIQAHRTNTTFRANLSTSRDE